MARPARPPLTVAQLRIAIDERLRAFQVDAPGLTLREKVIRLAELQREMRMLNVAVVAGEGLSTKSGRDRLRAYLLRYPETIIDGAELEVVGGISEYARRVRKLRVQEGYRIATGASPDPFSGIDLKPNQYMLTSSEADADHARRWGVANSVRRMKASAMNRILTFLKKNVNQVVTTEELAYVANDRREFGRRTRQLRTEEGYAIATRFNGRPDLRMGEYILLSVDRIAEPHDRNITSEVQKEVYARDDNTCRNPACRYQWSADDPRILELHHVIAHARRGPNTAENLIVLCNVCHDDLHAGRLDVEDCLGQP